MEENKNKTMAGCLVVGLIAIGVFGVFAGVLSLLRWPLVPP